MSAGNDWLETIRRSLAAGMGEIQLEYSVLLSQDGLNLLHECLEGVIGSIGHRPSMSYEERILAIEGVIKLLLRAKDTLEHEVYLDFHPKEYPPNIKSFSDYKTKLRMKKGGLI